VHAFSFLIAKILEKVQGTRHKEQERPKIKEAKKEDKNTRNAKA
jgi:hypothetical protein